MKQTKSDGIEQLAGDGALDQLKNILGEQPKQFDLDIALENAVAYSQLETAEYLLSLGADLSYQNYQGTYYAVHNGEIEGVKYVISKGVDVNVNDGMILNTSIVSTINTQNTKMLQWILENGANLNYLTIDSWSLINTYGNKELKSLIGNAKNH